MSNNVLKHELRGQRKACVSTPSPLVLSDPWLAGSGGQCDDFSVPDAELIDYDVPATTPFFLHGEKRVFDAFATPDHSFSKEQLDKMESFKPSQYASLCQPIPAPVVLELDVLVRRSTLTPSYPVAGTTQTDPDLQLVRSRRRLFLADCVAAAYRRHVMRWVLSLCLATWISSVTFARDCVAIMAAQNFHASSSRHLFFYYTLWYNFNRTRRESSMLALSLCANVGLLAINRMLVQIIALWNRALIVGRLHRTLIQGRRTDEYYIQAQHLDFFFTFFRAWLYGAKLRTAAKFITADLYMPWTRYQFTTRVFSCWRNLWMRAKFSAFGAPNRALAQVIEHRLPLNVTFNPPAPTTSASAPSSTDRARNQWTDFPCDRESSSPRWSFKPPAPLPKG